MQEICSSRADHVQFTFWGSAVAPVTGQAGAGTAKILSCGRRIQPKSCITPQAPLRTVWESWPKSSPHASCGSWLSEDCRVRLRQAYPVTDQKKHLCSLAWRNSRPAESPSPAQERCNDLLWLVLWYSLITSVEK